MHLISFTLGLLGGLVPYKNPPIWILKSADIMNFLSKFLGMM